VAAFNDFSRASPNAINASTWFSGSEVHSQSMGGLSPKSAWRNSRHPEYKTSSRSGAACHLSINANAFTGDELAHVGGAVSDLAFLRPRGGASMKRTVSAALAAALLGLASASAAGAPEAPLVPPDPASLSVPPLPLPFTEKDRRDGNSRYYFHKEGASYQAVIADLMLCTEYSHSVVLVARPINFIPLGSIVLAPDRRGAITRNAFGTLGLVGGIIGAYVEGEIVEGDMRLCMSYRGYKRYAVSREAYRATTRGSDIETMQRQAIVASGPAPLGGEVGP
jgi:hypothetical protein